MKFFPLKYVDVYFDEHKMLMEYQWNSKAENLTSEDYKISLMDILKLIKTYEPILVLGNISLESASLIAENKYWLDKNWFNQLQALGIERYALVNDKNVLRETLYEELFHNKLYQINIFEKREQAYNWLIDKTFNKVANID